MRTTRERRVRHHALPLQVSVPVSVPGGRPLFAQSRSFGEPSSQASASIVSRFAQRSADMIAHVSRAGYLQATDIPLRPNGSFDFWLAACLNRNGPHWACAFAD